MRFPYLITEKDNMYDNIITAFMKSENLKLPFVVVIDSSTIEDEITIERKENLKKEFAYKRNILKHVLHPIFSRYQYKKFNAKTAKGAPTTIQIPDIPNFPHGLPGSYQETINKYITFFDIFKDIRGEIVTGDTSISSSFALPPYNCVDLVTYIGGSIPLAIGAYLAGKRDVWAVTGDFGFLAAGHMGLLEIIDRETPIKIVIFYNKEAAATGGQKIHKKIMYRILSGYENLLTNISNPNDFMEISQVLQKVKDSNQPQIVLIDY
jgi:TPP-dependent indolepyruvate ferredoxin oxidoreductase alpha subunit